MVHLSKESLSRTKYVTKEMMVKRTLRSEEAGVFELLCWECQKSWSYMDDDVCVCCEYTRVGKSATRVCRKYTQVGKNVQCGQLCSAMPNLTVFAVTAHLQLIILLTADPSRGPEVNYALF